MILDYLRKAGPVAPEEKASAGARVAVWGNSGRVAFGNRLYRLSCLFGFRHESAKQHALQQASGLLITAVSRSPGQLLCPQIVGSPLSGCQGFTVTALIKPRVRIHFRHL
jgi:hypothetical protein